jgi:hypothetical protein
VQKIDTNKEENTCFQLNLAQDSKIKALFSCSSKNLNSSNAGQIKKSNKQKEN